MKQLFLIFTIIVLPILFISCEKPDEEAPTVTILTLQENDVVYEIVIISCIATDNEAVEKVELWLDGEYSGISDNTEPYKLEWNTTEYENRTYVVTVRVYDVNGNKSDSDPINIRVDNNLALPTAVNVLSVTYTLSAMTVQWSKSQDSDFASYTLLHSQSQNGNKTEVTTITDINTTSYSLNDFDPTHQNWFWIKVTDTFGYSSMGNAKSNTIELPPNSTDYLNISYQSSTFTITWERNWDNDFVKYELFESENQSGNNEQLIYSTTNQSNISHTVNNIVTNERRYYRLKITDVWDLQWNSSWFVGSSYYQILFQNNYDLYWVDIDGQNINQMADLRNPPKYTSISNNGQFVAYIEDSKHIMISSEPFDTISILVDGTSVSSNFSYPIFSRDGDVVFFMNYNNINQWGIGGIYTNGDSFYCGYSQMYGMGSLQVSGDLQYFYFRNIHWQGDIARVDIGGSNLIRLTEGYDARYIKLSHNDKYLFFSKQSNSGWLVNLETLNRIGISTDGYGATFSLDDSKLLYSTTNGIYTIKIDGTNMTNILNWGRKPKYSNDNNLITFEGNDGWIYIMNGDGSNVKQVVEGSNPIIRPIF